MQGSSFTFVLAYVVLNIATARVTEGNSFFGVAIGFTVAAGAFAVGGVSGGAFNPAVALGNCVLGAAAWISYLVYAAASLVAAALADGTFLYIEPSERPSRPRLSSSPEA